MLLLRFFFWPKKLDWSGDMLINFVAFLSIILVIFIFLNLLLHKRLFGCYVYSYRVIFRHAWSLSSWTPPMSKSWLCRPCVQDQWWCGSHHRRGTLHRPRRAGGVSTHTSPRCRAGGGLLSGRHNARHFSAQSHGIVEGHTQGRSLLKNTILNCILLPTIACILEAVLCDVKIAIAASGGGGQWRRQGARRGAQAPPTFICLTVMYPLN